MCESVKDILRGFMMLPIDLYILRSQLLLLNVALHSSRKVVKVCSDFMCYCDSVIVKCTELDVCLEFSTNNDIKQAIWNVFVKLCNW